MHHLRSYRSIVILLLGILLVGISLMIREIGGFSFLAPDAIAEQTSIPLVSTQKSVNPVNDSPEFQQSILPTITPAEKVPGACEKFAVDSTVNITGIIFCQQQGYSQCKSFTIETTLRFYTSKYGQCVGGNPDDFPWRTVTKRLCASHITLKPTSCVSNQKGRTKTDTSTEEMAKITCCNV